MLNTTDYTNEFDPNEIQTFKVMCILGYIQPFFFFPLVATNQSKVGRFIANQGLLVLITYGAVGVVQGTLSVLFSLIDAGWLGALLAPLYAIPTLLAVFGIVNISKGRVRDLPVIGHLRLIK
jgi:uncharacterized membrane protein